MARPTSHTAFFRLLGFTFGLVALMAIPAAANTVTLAWDANTEPDLQGYRIHYGTGAGIYSNTLDVGNVTTAQVTNLQPGQRYYFAVVAYNTAGLTSPLSAEVNALVPAPAPTVTAVSPTSGPIQGGTAITVTGTNFRAGATVTIGGVVAQNVVVVNQTTISAVTGATSTPGTFEVRVTNSDGTSAGLTQGFAYTSPVLAVTAIQPASGLTTGGTAVTITGANFVAGATVRFGTTTVPASSVTVLDPTTIVTVTPARSAGTVSVRVTNPNGQYATLTNAFTYVSGAPTISGVTPARGSWHGGTTLTITGTNFVGGMTVTVGGTPATNVTVLSTTTLTALTPAHPGAPAPTPETVDVSVANPNGQSATRTDAFTYEVGTFTRYFAEGVNSYFFITSLAFANPNARPATTTVDFLRSDGTRISRALTIPPLSRATLDARDVEGLVDQAFATTIQSDELLVIDRTVSWDTAHEFGAHAETAIERTSNVWYLAEGATQAGFDLFYLIQNPNDQPERVEITYLRPDGAPIVKEYDVPANSRFTIWVDIESPALSWTDVSAVVRSLSGRPIIVERSMYLNAGGLTWGAGHNSAGVTAPSTRWFFAEGATGQYFDTFILIANPSAQDASVRATYLLPSGQSFSKTYTVARNSRFNIWVDLEDPRLADTAVSTTIESQNGVPIIAERSMWWPGPTFMQWAEAHNSPGTTSTGTKWALAEGEEGGERDRTTYILVANTSPTLGQVKVTLLYEDGTNEDRTFQVPGNSRFNVWTRGEFPNSLGRRFGAIVESVGSNPAQIVVERAMYWNALGQVWAAGTNAVATLLSEPQ
ncbi:MAG: IPT/TIG domain-containing protein [Acidobacteria bacterium]|nr:IPT/TIG domain-containing protein [Acidobacteriota bacterium]